MKQLKIREEHLERELTGSCYRKIGIAIKNPRNNWSNFPWQEQSRRVTLTLWDVLLLAEVVRAVRLTALRATAPSAGRETSYITIIQLNGTPSELLVKTWKAIGEVPTSSWQFSASAESALPPLHLQNQNPGPSWSVSCLSPRPARKGPRSVAPLCTPDPKDFLFFILETVHGSAPTFLK